MLNDMRIRRLALLLTIAITIAGAYAYRNAFSLLFTLSPALTLAGFAGIFLFYFLIAALLRRSRLWAGGFRYSFLAFIAGGLGTLWFASTLAPAIHSIATASGIDTIRFSLTGGYPEELGKCLLTALILIAASSVWNQPWSGLIIGGLVGLGFELFENVINATTQAMSNLNSDAEGAITAWAARLLIGPGAHVVFTALAGYGISVALFSPHMSTAKRVANALAWPLFGFLLHFAFNLQADGIFPLIKAFFIVPFGAFVCLVLFWKSLRKARTLSDDPMDSNAARTPQPMSSPNPQP
ncbi:hypothetical protein GCM10007338_17690 [Corynebacterium pelargi]|uniref:Uncharacterized protein n=2 Tax=Corynebacterium pelargi TaxID=1471400 RepID=A0A410W6S0_9CORY|nr:hypothetical protein CPELA_01130 [Corynebacterium pelargi]GGG79774.1 hypothetical protein GCM10007338_17690 [Corynebacterium pelargi]